MQMKKLNYLAISLAVLLAASFRPALAQGEQPELVLRLSKNFGYSSGLGQMQGTFTLRATGPEDLARVVFLLDGQPVGEAHQPPFNLRFQTSDYALGDHTLQAIGYTTTGGELTSNEARVQFVTAEEGMRFVGNIIIPLVAVILVALLGSTLGPVLMNKGKNIDLPLGAERKYGISGGAICPRCQRPFSLHLFGVNLGPAHKLDRCPYCGKWALMRRRPLSELKAAEVAELGMAHAETQAPETVEAEKLHRDLENSRYQDL